MLKCKKEGSSVDAKGIQVSYHLSALKEFLAISNTFDTLFCVIFVWQFVSRC